MLYQGCLDIFLSYPNADLCKKLNVYQPLEIGCLSSAIIHHYKLVFIELHLYFMPSTTDYKGTLHEIFQLVFNCLQSN